MKLFLSSLYFHMALSHPPKSMFYISLTFSFLSLEIIDSIFNIFKLLFFFLHVAETIPFSSLLTLKRKKLKQKMRRKGKRINEDKLGGVTSFEVAAEPKSLKKQRTQSPQVHRSNITFLCMSQPFRCSRSPFIVTIKWLMTLFFKF